MGERAAESARQQDAASREYIRSVAASNGHGTADEIARKAGLRDRVISEAPSSRFYGHCYTDDLGPPPIVIRPVLVVARLDHQLKPALPRDV
jgi:hypothetical protein